MTSSTIIRAKWTVAEYHRLIEAGFLTDKQVELLDGELIEMTPEGIPHADLSDEASRYLRSVLGDRARVRDAKPITLPNRSEPEPDLCICRNVRYRDHHPYPEDIFWVVEYADSSLTKDLQVKRTIYATAGIQEYWVVNLQLRTLTVFRYPVQGDYQEQSTVSTGTISPLAFPDVILVVDRLLQ